MYLYIHPALTLTEFTGYRDILVAECIGFQRYLEEKYPDSYPVGLVFIPVKTAHPYPITNHYPKVIEEIYNTLKINGKPQCIMNAVYANKDFVDAGEIFMQNAYIETDAIVEYVRNISSDYDYTINFTATSQTEDWC
jgi:hypothetical protein